MKPIVGIDLGTTYSAIAALDSLGKASIVPNSEGERLTPSVIAFAENDPPELVLVGREAKHLRDLEPQNVVTDVKRDMGESSKQWRYRGRTYRPEELSSLILRKLSLDAESQLGKVRDAVITVPAYFAESHRRATMDAGELAGLNVSAIINEPTAAALFYATNHEVNGKIVVFDLGGGTFDVTVMRVAGRDIDIIASEGDRHLGGTDFDRVLAEIVNKKARLETGAPAFPSDIELQKFLNQAEERKRALTTRPNQRVLIQNDSGRAQVSVSREELEEGISPLVAKAEMLVEAVLDEARLDPGEISKVLLVGGSSRIPFVQRRLEAIFGFAPVTEVNLDEAVACGAALYSGLNALKENAALVPAGVRSGLSDVQLVEVANHSYGTITVSTDEETGRRILANDILIPKGSSLPCSETKTYYTMADGQDVIEVQITQGESKDPDNVNIIYQENMPLPPNRPAGRPIQVTYSYDKNQRMECSFRDVESGDLMAVELSSLEGALEAETKRKSRAALEEFQIE
ncbi:Hsp70 family protein [Thioalkalivibrio sp. XN8]|uniref:Hsp70 family protein n=1 Tax=Thioalkalivibrio sp. XN8 TaxID=2712863 RepID=UPI0013EADA61|nr:Hsp70 family protein [Thioalkalivibrio sp. XN8]